MTYYVDMNDESSLQEYQLTIINNGQVYFIYYYIRDKITAI